MPASLCIQKRRVLPDKICSVSLMRRDRLNIFLGNLKLFAGKADKPIDIGTDRPDGSAYILFFKPGDGDLQRRPYVSLWKERIVLSHIVFVISDIGFLRPSLPDYMGSSRIHRLWYYYSRPFGGHFSFHAWFGSRIMDRG